jgi:hypothetical protein
LTDGALFFHCAATIYNRLRLGWDVKRAITTPPNVKNRSKFK